MSLSYPYWYKLISHWVNSGHDGLTIPFILGAKRYIYGDEEFLENEICDLLEEITNSDIEEHLITFHFCLGIGENVLGLFNRINANYYQGKKFTNPQERISFAVGSGVNLGNTIEEISANLKEEYKAAIAGKNFSLVNSQWVPFTKGDQDMIKSVFDMNQI
ncbi:MAG: hypothetical protein ACJ748_08515 [Flavisolibacter sp.]